MEVELRPFILHRSNAIHCFIHFCITTLSICVIEHTKVIHNKTTCRKEGGKRHEDIFGSPSILGLNTRISFWGLNTRISFWVFLESTSYEDWGVDELIVEDSWKRQVGGDYFP